MQPLKLPPTSLVYPLVLERRVDELAALLNQQGDRLKLILSDDDSEVAAWSKVPFGDNFA
jgi:hypothetical protein